jgi:hypothetical protein
MDPYQLTPSAKGKLTFQMCFRRIYNELYDRWQHLWTSDQFVSSAWVDWAIIDAFPLGPHVWQQSSCVFTYSGQGADLSLGTNFSYYYYIYDYTGKNYIWGCKISHNISQHFPYFLILLSLWIHKARLVVLCSYRCLLTMVHGLLETTFSRYCWPWRLGDWSNRITWIGYII